MLAVGSGGGGERLVATLLAADAAGATVDAQNDKGWTPLMEASFKGHEGAVRLLLARGARQELQGKNGWLALHLAVKKGHAGIVEQLCAATGAAAALALRDKDGDTPLALAVSDGGGGERLVAALLAADVAGVTVDAQNDNGSTALIKASEGGREAALRLLLARGARQELQNKGGMTALHLAAEKGHAGVAEQLCAAPGAADAVALRGKTGNTPLVLAIAYGGGGERLIAALLAADAAGATVNAQNDLGNTALILACARDNEGAVRLLLERGARQELQGNGGLTALHCAAQEGLAGIVEQLCASPGAAASIALRDKGGYTPLALADREGHTACAASLLAHGARRSLCAQLSRAVSGAFASCWRAARCRCAASIVSA